MAVFFFKRVFALDDALIMTFERDARMVEVLLLLLVGRCGGRD